MNNINKIYIKHFSYHFIWVMTLLEAITVPLLVFLIHHQSKVAQPKSLWQGFITGFVGSFVMLYIINFFLKKLNLRINNEIIQLIKPVYVVALWCGIFLAVLFFFQKCIFMLHFIITNPLLLTSIVGFVANSVSIIIVCYLYRLLRPLQYFTIKIQTENTEYLLWELPIISIALYAGIYEAIALPIISVWTLATVHQTLDGLIMGALGGVIGSSVIVLLYNFVGRRDRTYFAFKKLAII